MSDTARHDVTQLLEAIGRGDQKASAELLPLVYEELRQLARARMAQEAGGGAGFTLQPTALVHEAYLRLVGGSDLKWDNRGHFFGAAARAMRRILVERARHQGRIKHGGGVKRVELGESALNQPLTNEPDPGNLLALDEVLERLEKYDKRKADVVMLRYFAGLSIEETAAALGVSPATVKNEWTFARAWLHREVERLGDEGGRYEAAMSEDRGKLVEDVFLQISQAAAAERGALLERLCNGDADLKKEVESLLSHHEASSDFLDSSDALAMASLLPTGFSAVGRADTALPAGKKIGTYTIVSQIGVGGMGVVYLAEQERPRRTVALKLMRRAMSTRGVLRRFEHEAEVLGRLQHPGIAQIFEAGTADWGYGEQPFFAMEYVKGSTLSAYAEKHRLGTRERLMLIAEVCDAVQHAHQRGVIHRDLKPGNILVSDAPASLRDSGGIGGKVKVLDFGVARLTGSDLMVTTLQTSVGQLIGTLPYMSPEQVAGESEQVDTRADVYALGVVLYELLAGKLPHDVRSRSLPEAARLIRDESPARLSSISKVFRGDVDTIVAKALEKDRSRRYQSAADLAADIRRYLAGEPIEAKRDSAMYVLRKQLRRYRGLVGLAAVLMLTLAGFAIYAGWQSRVRGRLLESERELSNDARIARDAAKTALKTTEEARDAALTAQRETEEQKRRADSEATKLRENLYFSRIGFAQAAISSNDAEQARRLLDLCPEDQRAWEWTYLRSRADEASHTIDARPYGGGNIFLSADGSKFVSMYQSGEVEVFDSATGARLFTPAVKGSAAWISVSPKMDRALSVLADGGVVVWDFSTGAVLREGSPVPEKVSISKFSPDGALVASQRRDFKAVTVWDPTTLAVKATVPIGSPSTLTFSPDGKRLAIGLGNGGMSVWSTSDWTPIKSFKAHAQIVRDIVFSPDSSVMATSSNDTTVRVWETSGWTLTDTVRTHTNKVAALAFSPDGRILASAGTDSVIKVTDVKSGDPLQALRGHSDTITSLAFAPDGRLFSTARDGKVRRWDNVGEPDEPTLLGVKCLAGVFFPDGKRVLTGGEFVEIIEVPAMKKARRLAGTKSSSWGVGVNDSGTLAAAATNEGAVFVWNSETGDLVSEFRGYKGRALETVFIPKSDLLLTCGDQGVVKIWDVGTGEIHKEWAYDDGAACCVAVSADGTLAIGTFPGPIELRDRDGAVLRRLTGHPYYTWSVAFTPDGKGLVSAGEDGSIRVWDVATGSQTHELRGHKGPVHIVSISPDGRRLISGGFDNTARLWDFATGQEIIGLRGHTGAVHGACFSPDGSTILTAGNEGVVKIWNAGSAK